MACHDISFTVWEHDDAKLVCEERRWGYSNTAARGAAENHYRTMTLAAIRGEPVRQLIANDAHLHLWTTNAFLQEAFDVLRP